ISQEYGVLPNSGEINVLKETETKINDLIKQLRELLDKSQNVSAAQKEEGKNLVSSMSERKTKLGEAIEEYNAFQRVLNAKPESSDFKTVLKAFADKYPRHPAAYEIQNVVKEYDDVQAVVTSIKNLYAESNGLKSYAEWQSKASVLKTQCDELADKITDPIDNFFKPINGLAQLAQTQPFSDKTFNESKKILGMLTQKELFPYIDKAGKWYYLLTKPEKGRPIFVATFVSEGKVCPNAIRDEDIERNTGKNGTQFAFAKEALKILNKTNDATSACEEVCSIWQRMFSEDYNALDPILRCVLIDLLYTDYSKTDPVFAVVFERYHGRVKDSGVDLMANWMDVESRSTVGERGKASTALEILPDLKPLLKEWKTKTADFTKMLAEFHPELECIGILFKQNGEWQCKVSNRPMVTKGKLYTFRQLGGKVQPNQIGFWNVGNATLTSTSTSACLQCLPVYLISEQ
ncbi:MAG: hypothetical protein LBQ50_11210, partial [Planctomycetaceae bacterium]|nr:hypothetical protein [Planctomycetaceae bacterium]